MPPVRNVAANTALAISTSTAQAGRASEERNSCSERATKVAMANRRSVRATPSTVTNGTDAPRRRRRTWSVYGVSTVPTRTGTTDVGQQADAGRREGVALPGAHAAERVDDHLEGRAAKRERDEQQAEGRGDPMPVGAHERVPYVRQPGPHNEQGGQEPSSRRRRSPSAGRATRADARYGPGAKALCGFLETRSWYSLASAEWPNLIEAGIARRRPGRRLTEVVIA